jgi:hexosaminidase
VNILKIDPRSINFKESDEKKNLNVWKIAKNRFIEMQNLKVTEKSPVDQGGYTLNIQTSFTDYSTVLDYETDERYDISCLITSSKDIVVKIESTNFFGARHALETLSQLIVNDELNFQLVLLTRFHIIDRPKFRHRGISLDTSRNFYSIDTIKRTINGMAMAKLNTLHWHIVDSQSFPMEVKSHPDMSRYGAHSATKVYSAADIKDLVVFATSRGVRIIPEFDAPAHVGENDFQKIALHLHYIFNSIFIHKSLGEGWQKKAELTTCLNAQPYSAYCFQPPCGHLDPTKYKLYEVLQDIYKEMMENFKPIAFHMGGDEIFFSCWNHSASLTQWMTDRSMTLDKDGFMELWGYFQTNALESLDKVSDKKVPLILWTSELTNEPYNSEYLDKDRYIIQIWSKQDDPMIETILKKGYRVIVSNSDVLYLDCGYGNWEGDKPIWCGPYSEWQKIYKLNITSEYGDQVYGAEATIWSESIDELSLDSRIWPRASALAERLWSSRFKFLVQLTFGLKIFNILKILT